MTAGSFASCGGGGDGGPDPLAGVDLTGHWNVELVPDPKASAGWSSPFLSEFNGIPIERPQDYHLGWGRAWVERVAQGPLDSYENRITGRDVVLRVEWVNKVTDLQHQYELLGTVVDADTIEGSEWLTARDPFHAAKLVYRGGFRLTRR